MQTLPSDIASAAAQPRNVMVRLCNAVEGIETILRNREMLTPPYPPLGANAFLVLNCLAQVRALFLDKPSKPVPAKQVADRLETLVHTFEDVCSTAGLGPGQVPYLAAAQERIFALEPFMSAPVNYNYQDPGFRAVVRDRLIDITTLELAIMKYLVDAPGITKAKGE
jgi:hypothetical protein